MDFAQLALTCAPSVNAELLAAIVRVESGFNPYAIGIVGDALTRQPGSLTEAVATAQALARDGFNFSIGLAQVNRTHFDRLSWSIDGRAGFEPCTNLRAAAEIFQRCRASALKKGYPATPTSSDPPTYTATHAALSCYYAGDHLRGARLGYVARVLAAQAAQAAPAPHPIKPRGTLASMMLDTHEPE